MFRCPKCSNEFPTLNEFNKHACQSQNFSWAPDHQAAASAMQVCEPFKPLILNSQPSQNLYQEPVERKLKRKQPDNETLPDWASGNLFNLGGMPVKGSLQKGKRAGTFQCSSQFAPHSRYRELFPENANEELDNSNSERPKKRQRKGAEKKYLAPADIAYRPMACDTIIPLPLDGFESFDRPFTYNRSDKSMASSLFDLNFDVRSMKGKKKVIAANAGEIMSFMNALKVTSEKNSVSKIYEGDGLLYNEVLKYQLYQAQKIVGAVADGSVFVANEYPCVIIEVTKFLKALGSGDEASKCEVLCAILNGYIDYYSGQFGCCIPTVRRSSFGYLMPTTAGLVSGLRLSVGVTPNLYANAAIMGIKKFLEDMEDFISQNVLNIRFEAPSFSSKNYHKYRNTQRKANKRKVKPFVLPTEPTVSSYLSSKITNQSMIYKEILRSPYGATNLTAACISALKENKNGLKEALLRMIASPGWKVDSALKHADGNSYSYASPVSATNDAEDKYFIYISDLIIASSLSNSSQALSTTFERWKRMLLASEDIFAESIQQLNLVENESSGYGSDSEWEDDEIYHTKMIFHSGMHSIVVALNIANEWMNNHLPISKSEYTIYFEEMYYEVPLHTLDVVKSLKRIKENDADILMGDVNYCATTFSAASKLNIRNCDWEKNKVIIVDTTSATLEQMNNLINKFTALGNENKLLIFVYSGLKRGQLGVDKNPFGVARFVSLASCEEQITLAIDEVKKQRKAIDPPLRILSHSVRRHFKILGATPTIGAIRNSNKFYRKNSMTSSLRKSAHIENASSEQVNELCRQLVENLQKLIQKQNIMQGEVDGWDLINVEAKGDCFFLALIKSMQCQGIEGAAGWSVATLRQAMAREYIKFLNEEPNRNIVGRGDLSPSEIQIHDRIAASYQWNFDQFDWLVSILAPRVIGRPICVYRGNVVLEKVLCESNNSADNNKQSVFVYLQQNHYQAMQRKNQINM